jgi:hypothetical protein
VTGRILCVADASALHELCRIVPPPRHPELLDGLTQRIDDAELGFPREVCKELQGIAREDPTIWAWASGLTTKLNSFNPDFIYMRTVMAHVVDLGFDHGIDQLESREGAFAPVCRLCCNLQADGHDFVLATEDTGEYPLRPTMEQMAVRAGWNHFSAGDALNHLGLADLLT